MRPAGGIGKRGGHVLGDLGDRLAILNGHLANPDIIAGEGVAGGEPLAEGGFRLRCAEGLPVRHALDEVGCNHLHEGRRVLGPVRLPGPGIGGLQLPAHCAGIVL